MIQIEAVTKVFGRDPSVTALSDVSIGIDRGVWGIVGPNGAGKTTLLGLILGFLRPSSGSVTVDGVAPRRYLRRHGVGYLPERFRLPAEWPVRAALTAFARLEGLDGRAARSAVARRIEELGLEKHADRPVGALSRGLAQRVGLAQALLADRRLVVLDEPTEGLDPLWRIRFRDLVTALRPERTVLLASHDLTEVERLADRVIVLDDGHLTDVIEARSEGDGPLRYRLVVRAPMADVRAAFPGVGEPAAADPDATGQAPERTSSAVHVTVTVADAGELSHRLGALLEKGATIHRVTPLSDDLEARVRQRLEDR